MSDFLLLDSPNGVEGIKKALWEMKKQVKRGKILLPVRFLAQELTANLLQKDYLSEIKEIFDFVQSKIRYVKDIRGVETIQFPEITLKVKSGDCDDKSVLIASLLESIGHKTRFSAVAIFPKKYSHVFVEVFYRGKWLSLDCTENKKIGWKPEYISNKIVLYN